MVNEYDPFPFTWDGERMLTKDSAYWRARAAERWEVGRLYNLVEYRERSGASHNHEFAWLDDAWKNLPEGVDAMYPTPQHLRKRALIDAGYFDEEIIDVGTHDAALRVASFVRRKDDFAMVIVRDGFVFVRTAKSQSRRAMKKKEFQDSKQAVMDRVEDIIGVPRGTYLDSGK